MARLARLASLIALICASSVVFAAHATAKDSLAPKSAGDRWLPCERWVMYHWNPVDMPSFYEQTGIRQTELFDWLQDDDHHTLGGLLRHKGLDPKQTLADSLAVKPATTASTRKVLLERTGRLLTQGHLAQHVFFHWFHNPSIRQNAREIFGMNPWDYARARNMGFSPADVGRLSRGYTRKQTAARIVKVMMRYEQRGVKWGATNQTEADHYRVRITKLADVWLDQRYHKKRPKGGLPGPTKAVGKDNAKRYMCRDFVGASQRRDGTTAGAASTRSLHGIFCPLGAATRRELAGESTTGA
ncbi:MAG: hypothetical protein QM648_10115 [Solirubrobacterales bacterium]